MVWRTLHYLIQSMIPLVKSLVLLIGSYQKRWEPYQSWKLTLRSSALPGTFSFCEHK